MIIKYLFYKLFIFIKLLKYILKNADNKHLKKYILHYNNGVFLYYM